MKEKQIKIGRCVWEQDVHGFYLLPLLGVSKVKGVWAVWFGWFYWLFTCNLREETTQ